MKQLRPGAVHCVDNRHGQRLGPTAHVLRHHGRVLGLELHHTHRASEGEAVWREGLRGEHEVALDLLHVTESEAAGRNIGHGGGGAVVSELPGPAPVQWTGQGGDGGRRSKGGVAGGGTGVGGMGSV